MVLRVALVSTAKTTSNRPPRLTSESHRKGVALSATPFFFQHETYKETWMRNKGQRAQAGFTLIELMIVVAIIGALSAVAIPSFLKYLQKAKTTEAFQQLEKIYNGARIYFMDQRTGKNQVQPIPPQFPESNPITPVVTCCSGTSDRCTPTTNYWTSPTWKELQFSISDPHYFRYSIESSGAGVNAAFTARAHADLDCDGEESTFEMFGAANHLGHDMTGSASVYRENPYE